MIIKCNLFYFFNVICFFVKLFNFLNFPELLFIKIWKDFYILKDN